LLFVRNMTQVAKKEGNSNIWIFLPTQASNMAT
jgi:hypothetical protein